MPTAITVTATQDTGPTANGMLLRVICLTGAASTQTGGTAVPNLTDTSPYYDQTLTTTVTGSRVYGAMFDWSSATSFTADANSTLIDNQADSTNGVQYGTFKATSLTGTPGATVLGASAPTGKIGAYAAAEILPDGTLQEDSSAPPPVWTATATTVTTASFTPPGGSLLLALVASDGNGGQRVRASVAGGGLGWSRLASAYDQSPLSATGGADIWIASVPPADPADPVITAQQGGVTANGIALRIYVLTQAAAVQNGATANQQFTTATSFTASITTTQTGSRVYGALSHTNQTDTAVALTTVVDDIADATNNERYCTFKATSLTGTPGATTLGATTSPATSGPFAMAEILTAGTLTEDASAPPVASTTSATGISCANFTPPAGALLVALVASDGGAGVTTMTVSGGGLAWSELVKNNPSSGDYAGVWVAQVPAASAPAAAARPGRTWRRRFKHRQLLQAAAPAASPDVTVTAPPATANGTSQPQPVTAISPAAGIPAATGTAPQATPAPSALAGAAAAAGTAPQPVVQISAVPGVPTAAGGDPAAASIAVLAGIPAATGTAPAPAIQTGLVVSAGIPVATGTAPAPVVSIAVLAGIPAAAGTAPAPAISIGALAGLAAATGAAPAPVPAIAVKPGIPVATGAAPQPAIISGLAVSAPAVTCTGTAPAPGITASVFAGATAVTGSAPAPARGILALIASAAGTAPQPKAAAAAAAGIPAAAGTAPQATPVSVLPHVTARSTAAVTAVNTSAGTVTDPRDGTASVTATRMSAPAVTDPRDGTTTVTAPATSTAGVT